MRGPAIAIVVAACLALAACGDETTIINESTTITPTTTTAAAAPTTTVPTGTTAPVPAPVPVEPEAEAEPKPEDEGLSETDEDYSGPCGEAGVITGGTPGPSARTAVPGYANVETVKANCALASTVAVQWVDQWDPSCLAGCTRRIEDLGCQYAGSGSSVQCLSPNRTVSFDLGFQIE